MRDKDGVTVLIPTYNRQDVLYGTVQRIHYHIKYTGGDLNILIGDDSDDLDLTRRYVKAMQDNISPYITLLENQKRGLGENLNMLLRESPTEIVLQMDDDHYLNYVIDIDEYVHELKTDPAFGWIRLFMGEKEDSDKKQTYYKFHAETYGRYWLLIPGTGELYIPSNRPHLKRIAFHERYGYYKEGVKLGQQETEFCHRFQNMWKNDGELNVFIPMYPPGLDAWSHVGESWQKKGL